MGAFTKDNSQFWVMRARVGWVMRVTNAFFHPTLTFYPVFLAHIYYYENISFIMCLLIPYLIN